MLYTLINLIKSDLFFNLNNICVYIERERDACPPHGMFSELAISRSSTELYNL